MNEMNFIDFVLLSWYYFKAKIQSKFLGVALAIGLHLNEKKENGTEE